jgi:hypothetical protein
VEDKRMLIVGLLWWMRKNGMSVALSEAAS